jgi:parallel beta-helix repeat protein
MKTICFFSLLLFSAMAVTGAVFYVDPESGSMDGDGSLNSPWSTLSEVFSQDKIESRTSSGSVINAGAPVKAGDTLVVHTGYHGTLDVNGYFNEDYITIMAAPGHTPRLGFIRMREVSQWLLKGLHVSPSFMSDYSTRGLIAIQGGSEDVIVDGCTAYSVENASGWSSGDWNNLACNGLEAWQSTRIIARNNHFKNVDFGMETGDYGLLEYNVVENFSGDGMRCNGEFTVIQYNIIKNCYNVNDNHDDGIQAWTTGDGGVGTGVIRENVLRGNIIINHEDPNQSFQGGLQGIGLFDGTFQGWLITNNVVVTNHWHGITLLGAVDCRVINNTVVDIDNQDPGPPWIRIAAHKNGTPSSGCLVRNNLTTDLANDDNVVEDHNIQIASFADYQDHFENYSEFNLKLISTSSAIDAGTADEAPALDRDRAPRPYGDAVDVGAYEYGSVPTAITVRQPYRRRSGGCGMRIIIPLFGTVPDLQSVIWDLNGRRLSVFPSRAPASPGLYRAGKTGVTGK